VESAKRFKTKAKNEVILSAGSVGSPQILMLSGIGDAEELESHGVTVMKDLRDVGKNLQDHHLLFGNHVRPRFCQPHPNDL
jgi:choline dehydrogenase